VVLAAACIGFARAGTAQEPILLDDFEDVTGWSAHPADGVELTLGSGPGVEGRSLQLDFRFVTGGGYAVARKEFSFDLPENYQFVLQLRADAPVNNLEFKLLDDSGENVWWMNRRDYEFPRQWEALKIKKRHIQFAWGPVGGGEMSHVAAIEFAITAGTGGEGTVWIDQLTLEPLPPPETTPREPQASASLSHPGHHPGLATDGNLESFWWSESGDPAPWFEIDFQGVREYGGLVIDWVEGKHAANYSVDVSNDRQEWVTVRTVTGSYGGPDYLYIPEMESRYVMIRIADPSTLEGYAIQEITVKPLEWSSSIDAFFQAVAQDAPRGSYPRAITGEKAYWTIIGTSGGQHEALFNEDGLLESAKASFSIEPFLFVDDNLITWNDVETEQSLEDGFLPMPSVRWVSDAIELTVSPFVTDEPDGSLIYARYRLLNTAATGMEATLFLAIRPFQVNPPWQSLNMPGGIAPVPMLTRAGRVILMDGNRGVASLTPASGFGAATFDEGNIVENLRQGLLPAEEYARDSFGYASGVFSYTYDLNPGEGAEVDLLIPFEGIPKPPPAAVDPVELGVVEAHDRTRAFWEKELNRVTIALPDTAAAVVNTIRSQLAYILINRDGPSIQPGSRSYERSWIRDGSLTSTALLRLAHPQEVRDFIEWFGSYQYDNGKVPCCVDLRGADPVAEHDSHGELIYLIAEYYRYTKDIALLESMWPAVEKAALHLDSLRHQRRTEEYRTLENGSLYGLLPPSISHEGYSAKPMHSYWDDLFALRGFKDAVYLAGVLGLTNEKNRWTAVRDEFQDDLVASMNAALENHGIDYLPGCADLGDFDATSTTIALSPVQARNALPEAALVRTFEKYYEFFVARRDGRESWEAFTPYEMRNIGAFVRLGWRDRANELLDFFMQYRRPTGWAEWAEVVWREPRTPKFVGDMPHTWVGSDFIRSVLDMLAYEREEDEALVLGAGVPLTWAAQDSGVEVRNLPTRHGNLDFTVRVQGHSIAVRIEGKLEIPPGGIIVAPPPLTATGYRRATIDGAPAEITPEGTVVVRQLPAHVVMQP
jgi:hypothetical protein